MMTRDTYRRSIAVPAIRAERKEARAASLLSYRAKCRLLAAIHASGIDARIQAESAAWYRIEASAVKVRTGKRETGLPVYAIGHAELPAWARGQADREVSASAESAIGGGE